MSVAELKGKTPAVGEKYRFRLLVASNDPESVQAKGCLEALIESHLNGMCQVEVIDITEDLAAALKHRAVVTPMLIMLEPKPQVTIVGSLRDTAKVLAALRLP